MSKMDPEELELVNDYRYRSYSSVIEKALRNFESSSEWADLISSLGKLNKALQSNLKYSLLPKRLIIGKRLAQCLHPALPSGVHLKALETYEIIFKIIGTKWLAKDLFIYSAGLFPLLGHAAMSVKPVLLTLYERYYLPLQKSLLPSLQALLTGLLPGLEEGLGVYDRTDTLLQKLSLLVGQEVFYGTLWGSVLISPLVRLPASLFIVSHINKGVPGNKQKFMLGTDYKRTVKAMCLSVQDSNVLVQRNMLEILLFFFPFCTCLDSGESTIPLLRAEMVNIVSAASLTLLRRDMSLNRRFYAWLLGTDIKGGILAPDPTRSSSIEDHATFYFDKYSRDLLIQALINIMNQENIESEPENGPHPYLKPFRIMISLLDKPEIGPQITGDLLLEAIRAFYGYCKEALGEDILLSSSHTGNPLTSKIKENKNASELIKTVNMFISSLSSEYLWDYMARCFEASLSMESPQDLLVPFANNWSLVPSVSELCKQIMFLLDVIPLELYSEIQTQYLPQMLNNLLQGLLGHIHDLSLPELTQGLKACFKVLSKIQMPVAYMDLEPQSDMHSDQDLTQLKKDCHIQNIAISTLLEMINHSQSLALVIEDKSRRYKSSGSNPFYGRLQMVTVPLINPGVLKIISEKTDFYQRVAHVLWNQLNMENREHHITCVELFYKLHCLAPSSSICEDIICLALLDRDKGSRLEALYRFSVLWHLTRDIQSSRTMSLNRSFDRSLFVVLDSLNCQDGAISAGAQGWLVRAFSLNDVVRIVEPVLLLLLHPRTQRSSIQCIKQNLTVGNLKIMNTFMNSDRTLSKESVTSSDLGESYSEESLLSRVTTVDRDALWAEVESIPETMKVHHEPKLEKESEGPHAHQENERSRTEMGEDEEQREESEHTESADTSMGHLSTENTSSASAPYLQRQDSNSSGEEDESEPDDKGGLKKDYSMNSSHHALHRTDSERTQASESLSSDEEDQELDAMARSRLLKQQKEKREMIDSLFKHMLLYLQPYDSKRVLYAFSVLEAVLKTNLKEFVEAVSTTSMDTSSTAHLNLIYNLLARHQEALVGRSFYGKLQAQSPISCPHSLLIELLTYLCLNFLRSYYPCYLIVGHRDLLGNRDVQVKSVEVLIRVMSQLVLVAKSQDDRNLNFIRKLLSNCKVQEYVLLSLSASMYINQKPISCKGSEDFLEGGLSDESLINFGQDQIWSEHPLQIELLKLLQVLIVLEHHLKGTLSSKKENIAPDYPLTLLEGLTTITHFCLLENSSVHKKSHSSTDPADLRNARNGILEELPRIMNSMSLLWGVIGKEESQKKSADIAGGATSVYFKSTKILRQRVLEFLTPLTAQHGVQLMASVAAVWNSRKSHKSQTKNKILPVASESRLTVVELVQALETLKTDNILQLIKEVVKKPPQIKRDQKSTLVDIPMLQFSYAFVQGISAGTLQENVPSLISLLKESTQLNLAPPGYFLLLGILNDFVNRLPNLDNKKDQKDLQEVTQKILEAVGNVAGSSLAQTSWLSRNLEVKAQPQVFLNEEDPDMDLYGMQSSSLKLFPNYEQKAMLLKRQAFAIFSGELDQYHMYLPLIQERLTENLRVGQTCLVSAQMFLTFRVLLLRISPQHLTSLWPIMVTELIQAFIQLEENLDEEEEDLKYRWAFVPEVDTDGCNSLENNTLETYQECKPHVVRVMERLNKRCGDLNEMSEMNNSKNLEFPLLTLRSISSITQLVPFLKILSCTFKAHTGGDQGASARSVLPLEYPAANSDGILKKLEESIECEFLESMDN
ncbi:UNVERIFIED_CONTAM: hypothetical protein FKN15_003285 [Acipenser sinensis]